MTQRYLALTQRVEAASPVMSLFNGSGGADGVAALSGQRISFRA
jgi:hypothetical protein